MPIDFNKQGLTPETVLDSIKDGSLTDDLNFRKVGENQVLYVKHGSKGATLRGNTRHSKDNTNWSLEKDSARRSVIAWVQGLGLSEHETERLVSDVRSKSQLTGGDLREIATRAQQELQVADNLGIDRKDGVVVDLKPGSDSSRDLTTRFKKVHKYIWKHLPSNARGESMRYFKRAREWARNGNESAAQYCLNQAMKSVNRSRRKTERLQEMVALEASKQRPEIFQRVPAVAQMYLIRLQIAENAAKLGNEKAVRAFVESARSFRNDMEKGTEFEGDQQRLQKLVSDMFDLRLIDQEELIRTHEWLRANVEEGGWQQTVNCERGLLDSVMRMLDPGERRKKSGKHRNPQSQQVS